MTYQYQSPLDQGYTKIKVSKARHNQVFKYRQRTFFKSLFERYDYFSNGKQVIVENLPTLLTKVLAVLFVPVTLVLCGLANYKEFFHELKRDLFPRKYGRFIRDDIIGEQAAYLIAPEHAVQ